MAEASVERTVLITGGSNGLGYHCARELLASGEWQVVVTSPDAGRARAAAERLAADTGHDTVLGMALKLDDQSAIRSFAAALHRQGLPPLRAAVFNAGVQLKSFGARTQEGIEMIFGVNHLGHFLLANLLVNQLQAPARLVFVSSSTHDPAQRSGITAPPYTNARDLAYPPALEQGGEVPGKAVGWAYASSKLCNILCAYELDRRLRQCGLSTVDAPVTVNAFDPGLMPGTSLARQQGPVFQWLWRHVLPLLSHLFTSVNSAEQSGKALARLVTDDKLSNVSGKYFVGNAPQRSSDDSYDEAKARELWETSAELTRLQPEETPLRS